MRIRANINQYYHQNSKDPFFSNISFEVNEPGFYLITGESGIGKSTLMKILLNLYTGRLDGSVIYTFHNKEYTGKDLCKKGFFGYQPDNFSLVPWKDVYENIVLPSRLNKYLEKPNTDIIINELNLLGISEEDLRLFPHELSFGMKARIGVIRALLYDPRILFLDELYSGIDSFNCSALNKYLFKHKEKTIIIAISHQIERALEISDKAFHLENSNNGIDINSYEKQSFNLLLNSYEK